MSIPNLLIILVVWSVTIALVGVFLFVYLQGRGGESIPGKTGLLARTMQRIGLRQRVTFRRQNAPADQAPSALVEPAVPSRFRYSFDQTGAFPSVASSQEMSSNPLSELYRRIGKRQRVAGICFMVASITFLILSITLRSVSLVFEVDSVFSFAVAVILFLKESRDRVQSRVLNAVVTSLGTTIAELSSRAGSGFLYVPSGKSISEVTAVGLAYGKAEEGFRIVPPGMGLAELFAREAGASITPESLKYLIPSVISEKLGIAESVKVSSIDSRVEVLLRRPAIFCNCQKDELRSGGVVGCTVSSFLAILYSFGSRKTVSLDRCTTDNDAGTWQISLNLQGSPA